MEYLIFTEDDDIQGSLPEGLILQTTLPHKKIYVVGDKLYDVTIYPRSPSLPPDLL